MINRSIVNEYPILSSASYETGNGFFSLKSIGRVAGIELHYKGVIEFDMNVPDGWLYTFRKNYLVIVADSEEPLSEILFQYRGKLTIIKLLGTGKPLRQFMYAGDFARVIKEVIDKKITESFNVASKDNLSINDIAKIALKACNCEHMSIEYDTSKPDGQYRKDVSTEKMHSIFSDLQFTRLEEGIKQVYNSLHNENNIS